MTRPERGAGLIGTIAGVTVFLAFLTVALQILLDLHTTSVVTAATYDAARIVAADEDQPPTPGELAAAEDHARELLGGLGPRARFTWDLADPDVVRLRVQVATQRFLLPVVAGVLGLDEVDRTVTVRVERLQ